MMIKGSLLRSIPTVKRFRAKTFRSPKTGRKIAVLGV